MKLFSQTVFSDRFCEASGNTYVCWWQPVEWIESGIPFLMDTCPQISHYALWWLLDKSHTLELLSSQNNMVVLKTVCCRAALVVRGISSSPCISDRGGLRLLKMPGGFRSPSNDKNWFLCITCDLFSPNVGFLLVLLILKPTYQTLHNHKKGREEPH